MTPKILHIAPFKDFSGYASASRDYARALLTTGAPLAIRNLIYDAGNIDLHSSLVETLKVSVEDTRIVIQQTTPNEMHRQEGCFNVGVFCWETDKIPKEWVDSLNVMDLVIVPCEDNLKAVRLAGVLTPIVKVPYATDVERFNKPIQPFQFGELANRFKFLSVCQWSKKKGVDALLKAYFTEFADNENVLLVLKTYVGMNDGEGEQQKVIGLINGIKASLRLKTYPPVKLIHEVMTSEALDRLYSSCDCYALPSRGEGWGVPHFDAMGFGLPAIATRDTGPQEFITPACGWLVDYQIAPVEDMPHPFEFLYTGKENWKEPNVHHLKSIMREAFEIGSRRSKVSWSLMKSAASQRADDFSHEKIGKVLLDEIMSHYEKWKK